MKISNNDNDNNNNNINRKNTKKSIQIINNEISQYNYS